MKIYTLGTSHGDSTYSRFNSSTAYETQSGALYLLDVGAPAEALLRRKGLALYKLRAAFVTHMHDDHAGGLTGLMKQIIKYPRQRTEEFALYLPEARAVGALKNWFLALHEEAEHRFLSYHVVDDGLIYEDDELAVTAIRTEHLRTRGRTEGDPCSFAYILHFKKENRTILHTGDLRSDFADFPKISALRHFDACLCEATHYKPEDAQELLANAKFGRLIFIHVSNRWHDLFDYKGEGAHGEAALLEYCKTLPYPVSVAHDGDEFVL